MVLSSPSASPMAALSVDTPHSCATAAEAASPSTRAPPSLRPLTTSLAEVSMPATPTNTPVAAGAPSRRPPRCAVGDELRVVVTGQPASDRLLTFVEAHTPSSLRSSEFAFHSERIDATWSLLPRSRSSSAGSAGAAGAGDAVSSASASSQTGSAVSAASPAHDGGVHVSAASAVSQGSAVAVAVNVNSGGVNTLHAIDVSLLLWSLFDHYVTHGDPLNSSLLRCVPLLSRRVASVCAVGRAW
jgi:hypothetical protein